MHKQYPIRIDLNKFAFKKNGFGFKRDENNSTYQPSENKSSRLFDVKIWFYPQTPTQEKLKCKSHYHPSPASRRLPPADEIN